MMLTIVFFVPFSIKQMPRNVRCQNGKKGPFGRPLFRRTCARTSSGIGFLFSGRTAANFYFFRGNALQQTICLQGLLDLLLVCFRRLYQRQTARAGIPAQQIHGILYRDGVYLAEHRFTQRQHFQLQAAGFGSVALKPCLAAVVYQLRITLDTTLITPLPPKDNRGTTWSSLPEYRFNSSPHSCASFAT